MYYYDLHCHSEESFDSQSKIIDIVKIAKKRQISGVAITNHNSVYRGPTNIDGIALIPGSEITLKNGTHLLAFFIKKALKEGQYTLKAAVREIHRQGGYAILAHPFRDNQGWFSQEQDDRTLIPVDGIEKVNAKNLPYQNRLTEGHVRRSLSNNLFTAGSDAHVPGEVGFAYIKTAQKLTQKNFVVVLAAAEVVLKVSTAQVNLIGDQKRQLAVTITKLLGIYYVRPIRDLLYRLYIWYNRHKKSLLKIN